MWRGRCRRRTNNWFDCWHFKSWSHWRIFSILCLVFEPIFESQGKNRRLSFHSSKALATVETLEENCLFHIEVIWGGEREKKVTNTLVKNQFFIFNQLTTIGWGSTGCSTKLPEKLLALKQSFFFLFYRNKNYPIWIELFSFVFVRKFKQTKISSRISCYFLILRQKQHKKFNIVLVLNSPAILTSKHKLFWHNREENCHLNNKFLFSSRSFFIFCHCHIFFHLYEK